jgi:hypothetical protein
MSAGSGGSAPVLLRLGLAFAALIFVVDQASKWLILDVLFLPERQNIPLLAAGPFGLDLTMVWNRGVTFGLLSGDGASVTVNQLTVNARDMSPDARDRLRAILQESKDNIKTIEA